MKLILDTANLDDIKYFNTYYPISGVTTNPTILSREGGDIVKHLYTIREIIGEDKELHIQVTETEFDKIVSEAKAIVKAFGKNTFVKIPATDVGLRATAALAKEGIGVTVTAVFSAGQALLAATAGAAYVAPYVSRLENICEDGIGVVAEIQQVLDCGDYDTVILACRFGRRDGFRRRSEEAALSHLDRHLDRQLCSRLEKGVRRSHPFGTPEGLMRPLRRRS